MTRPILVLSLFVVVAGGLLPAQRTWIVDRSNGLGTDFTDLPAAVAAAAPGDTLQVRPAPGRWYTAPVVDKGLSILGDPISRFDLVGTIEVRNVVATQSFTLANLRIGTPNVTPPNTLNSWRGMNAHDNQGPLYFDSIEYGVNPANSTGRTDPLGFLIDRCALVTMSRSTVYGSNAVTTIRDSTFMATQCTFMGSHYAFVGWPDPKPEAMFIKRSTAWLIDCNVTGTDGDPNRQPTPAIVPCISTTYIGGQSQILGGNYYGGGPAPAIAINLSFLHNGCSTPFPFVFVDPRAFVLGIASPPVIVNNGPIASLTWDIQSVPSRALITTQYTRPFSGGLTALVAGGILPAPQLSPAPPLLGPLVLDPAQAFVLDIGFANAQNIRQVSIPIPPIVFPIALPIQAVDFSATGQALLTNFIIPRVN